ncbi:hypothetical protein TNCV_1114421 [Trichonephila clavipes]|nr:hypothetical protein TNCV_1114421 [Trichonephila clavipes]
MVKFCTVILKFQDRRLESGRTKSSNSHPNARISGHYASWRSGKVDGGSKLRNETGVSQLWAVVEAGSRYAQRYLLHPRREKNGLPVPLAGYHAEFLLAF